MINSVRLVKNFVEMAQTESESFKEKKLAQLIINKLALMGVDVRVDFSQEQVGSNTGNVVVRLPGKKSVPTLLFLAHMDTVSPGVGVQPVIDNGVIRSDGDTILGADDKAGIAAILEAIQILRDERIGHGNIVIIFTVAEEKGSLGAKNLDYDALKVDYGFVLDGDGPVGNIITKTSSQSIIKAKFVGKAAHAGISPELGVDTIQAAAKAISKMKLGKVDEETTANIGVIKGGTSFNVVPAVTYIEGEARSFSVDKLKAQIGHMENCFIEGAKEFNVKVEVKAKSGFTAYELKPSDKVVNIASSAIKNIGLKPELVASRGGSDANVLNEKGISAVNLGIGMKNPHSRDESIAVEQLELLTKVLLEIIKIES